MLENVAETVPSAAVASGGASGSRDCVSKRMFELGNRMDRMTRARLPTGSRAGACAVATAVMDSMTNSTPKTRMSTSARWAASERLRIDTVQWTGCAANLSSHRRPAAITRPDGRRQACRSTPFGTAIGECTSGHPSGQEDRSRPTALPENRKNRLAWRRRRRQPCVSDVTLRVIPPRLSRMTTTSQSGRRSYKKGKSRLCNP